MINCQTTQLNSELSRLNTALIANNNQISHREKRTLIFIQIIPSAQKEKEEKEKEPSEHQCFKYEVNDEFDYNSNEADESLVHNLYMLKTSKSKLEDQIYKNQHHFFEETQQNNRQTEFEQSDKVIFTIILHHDLYPYEAPYVTVSMKDHFPRVDDFRNYFYQIMQIDRWWPLITLKEIISRMPSFAYHLLRSMRCKDTCFGQFQYETPIYRQELLQISPHFFVCKVQIKRWHNGPLRSYSNGLIYFTYNELVMLEQDANNRLKVKDLLPIEQMTSIQSKFIDKTLKLAFKWLQSAVLKIKLEVNKMDNSELQRINLFLTYYSLIVQPVKQQQQKLVAIDICNQIIIKAYQLHYYYIVEWAKRKIVYISQDLKQQP